MVSVEWPGRGDFCAQPRLPRAGGPGRGRVGGLVLQAFELGGQQFSALGLSLRQSAAAPCWALSCLRPASPVGESWHPEARVGISAPGGPNPGKGGRARGGEGAPCPEQSELRGRQ